MSSQASSRYPSTVHPRMRIYTTDSYKNYYTPYEPCMARSSSPIRSSSPPMTPSSIRHARSDAFIRSSPEISSDTLFHGVREHIEDPSSAWGPRYSSNGYPDRAYTPSKHDYFSIHRYPPPSDFDVSEYSEDVDHDNLEADSEHMTDSPPGRNSVFFSDTEEEENHGDDEFSFGHGYRTTFFRTSAERGQWKSNPIPFKSTPLPQVQRSASIPSRLPTPVDSTRTNSEPAPSTVSGLRFSLKPDQYDNLRDADDLPTSFGNIAEGELQPEAESPRTMPSMTSDWESIPDIDVDGYERPSSPLPPSSPISYSLSRSVSPASSPMMRPSSPLSEVSSLDQEEIQALDMEGVHTGHPDIEVKIRSSVLTPISMLDADIKSGNALDEEPAIVPSTMPSLKSDSASVSVDATVTSDFQVLEPLNSFSSAATAQNHDHETKHSSSIAGNEADITFEATVAVPPDSLVVNCPTDSIENQAHLSDITHPEGHKQEIQEHLSTTRMKVEDDNNKEPAARKKRRKGNDNGDDSQRSIVKKPRVDAKVGRVTDLSQLMTHNPVRNEKTGAQAEKDENNPEEQVSAKPKRRRKLQVEVSISCPASSTKRSKPHRLPLPKASSSYSHLTSVGGIHNTNDHHQPVQLPSTQDPERAALNAEICGMLIETMALSRASSLPLSSLYKMMMQAQPSLRPQRSEQEWLAVFAQVLHEGEAGKGSGVFGKVESSGKDDSNRPLEAQWFYVPEKDEDQERAALIRSMMPRPAKRTETKKYKQYYWRPLDKISKWDPEDEL
ncbi:hypothetical protein BYT27DRAFT_7174996 [Phlegmacium glaucopus]|nr:hypothetical protein BYT27DRAFT_7174996 [Phlegmacium glaucopus]